MRKRVLALSIAAMVEGLGFGAPPHRWEYRNPYSRQCTCCGLVQDQYGMSMADTGWWEDMQPGRDAPCNPRPTGHKESA